MAEEQQQPALVINSQYIKDLSMEIPLAPEIFLQAAAQPELKIDVAINTKTLENHMYNVDLTLTLNGDIADKKLFILELTYSALTTLNLPAEHLEPVLNIEIPRLLFPFARNIISQSLMEAGLPPIMLNPIDFAALYTARKQAKEQN